ncbi:MAG TPA: HPr family phosphocarrier protein [Alphaproteobacteria bacterium]|nr:HPr family phosphocarrier protein [Alphaproteobacteria bacterium]
MSKIVKKIVSIQNRKGLHARASAQMVNLAESFQAMTYVCYQDMRVPAGSIMGLLMLGVGQGAQILIEGEGVDADKAVSSLVSLIENKFGEEQW